VIENFPDNIDERRITEVEGIMPTNNINMCLLRIIRLIKLYKRKPTTTLAIIPTNIDTRYALYSSFIFKPPFQKNKKERN
jgi:hypothetical protein